MRHVAISPELSLGVQLEHLACIAAVSAWIAWLWTNEEIFADAQVWLKDIVKKNRELLRLEFFVKDGNRRPWKSILQHWAKQKLAFGMTCQTCVVHYPSAVFIFYNGYHLVERGFWGSFYAWMFTAFTADSILWLLGVMKEGKTMEDSVSKGLEAGLTILQDKVKKLEKDNIDDVLDTATHPSHVRFEHSGPTI